MARAAARPAGDVPPDPWDPVVRLTHWAVAGIVLANALFTHGGGLVHIWLGWIAMALLALRLVWGIAGPKAARFTAFPPRPLAALGHLRDLIRGTVRDYPSHNPAGAMMVYALWIVIALAIGTGLTMTKGATPMEIARRNAVVTTGDWSTLVETGESGESDDEDRSGLVKGLHEAAANLLLLLAVLHLAGVLVESAALRRNLVRPMIGVRTGRR